MMQHLVSLRRTLCAATLVAAGVHVSATTVDDGLPILQGWGTATIDGVLSPGEWAGAARLDFNANVPGGGTTPASLFVMNDATNLYVAIVAERPALDITVQLGAWFDNDDDGVNATGDDTFVTWSGLYAGWTRYFDDFVWMLPPCPPGAMCSRYDTDDGGTTDGVSMITNDGSLTVIELQKPLRSGDVGHDFDLSAGNQVGFRMFFELWDLSSMTWLNGHIRVAEPPATLEFLSALVTSYNLRQGIATALDVKLQNVQAAVTAANAGQRQDAAEKLLAFINAVEAQRGKELTNAQADVLVALARRIVALL